MFEEVRKKKYFDFLDEIKRKEELTVTTLGPEGTSSHRALCSLKNMINKVNPKIKLIMKLENNFEYVYENLRDEKVDYALVPAAYEKITNFFWTADFYNSYNFIYDTPMYGIVKRKGEDFENKEKIVVASCPAVEKLTLQLESYENLSSKTMIKRVTNSTTEAATLLSKGEVDIAVTNETSYDLFSEEIEFISKKQSSQMLWCLFKRR